MTTDIKASVQKLRSKFLDKAHELQKNFHPKDMTRVSNDDAWLKRFLAHNNDNVDEAINMMIQTCEWRKNNGVNDINESNVKREYLEEGSLFIRNKDKDGHPLLIFKCCKHVKGTKSFEELKKIVVYWFERAERCEGAEQITIFMDMCHTGVSNMDTEYTKYLINLCKQYYPYFLNYILIFEMPWVLNAAFVVIKSLLPSTAVQKIRFVTKSNLYEYVEKNQALISWGGTDPYTFTLVPMDQAKVDENKKKVHFADGSPLAESTIGFGDELQDDTLKTSRLSITPTDAVTFKLEFKELIGVIKIKNTSDIPVSYKVKTTSPEKFKVRQSLGMLSVGASTSIDITVISGYTPTQILRDKFLVLNLPVETAQNIVLSEFWRSYDTKSLEQHFLKCKVAPLTVSQNGTAGSLLSEDLPSPISTELDEKIAQLLISIVINAQGNSNMAIMTIEYESSILYDHGKLSDYENKPNMNYVMLDFKRQYPTNKFDKNTKLAKKLLACCTHGSFGTRVKYTFGDKSGQNGHDGTCVIYENFPKRYNKMNNRYIDASVTHLIKSMNHVTECCVQLKSDIRFLQRIVLFLTFTTFFLAVLMFYR